nr:nuclease-related domain-containing protein [Lysinibacillus timonensis]
MILKTRAESLELNILKSLNNRIILSEKDRQYYLNLKKGYEGELLFDTILEMLEGNYLILNDLLLKTNNNTYQIDSLLIMSDTIFVFEVKNYEGDFIYETTSDKIYTKTKIEIVNPLIQLKRTETLLHQLLQSFGFTIKIDTSVIFVNPEFTLYQAPMELPFIFPTQINRFIKKLNAKHSKITEKHQLIADKLLSLHMRESQNSKLPKFEYEQLKKGITCEACGSFLVSDMGRSCVCKECGHIEEVSSAVIRSIKEFQLLFPNLKITTNIIYDWCQVIKYKKKIYRILERNLKMIGTNRWVVYE